MIVISNPQGLSRELRKAKLKNKSIGFVPTMGALHAGHVSLIRKARKENSIAVVSIFVNPAQFGPKEDLEKYPRPKKDDLKICRKEKIDFVFYPALSQVYPDGFSTLVEVKGLSEVFCGESRPGHFRGVTTVVSKLFNIVQPDTAYFGQKDCQQAAIIKKMTADLNFPIKIKVLPTVREKSGLALSSRNSHLSAQEKTEAAVIFKALKLAEAMVKSGQSDTKNIIGAMREMINKKASARIDYIMAVDPESFKPMKMISRNCLVIAAVHIGKTRLIDNILIT